MKSTHLRAWIVISAFVTSLSGCIRSTPTPGRNCDIASHARYALYVDGILAGVFSSFERGATMITLHDGVIPPGSFVMDWKSYNQAGPLVLERHDLELYAMGPDGNPSGRPIELQGSLLLNVDGAPAADNPGCLLFEDLMVRPDTIIQRFRGAPTTPPRSVQKPRRG